MFKTFRNSPKLKIKLNLEAHESKLSTFQHANWDHHFLLTLQQQLPLHLIRMVSILTGIVTSPKQSPPPGSRRATKLQSGAKSRLQWNAWKPQTGALSQWRDKITSKVWQRTKSEKARIPRIVRKMRQQAADATLHAGFLNRGPTRRFWRRPDRVERTHLRSIRPVWTWDSAFLSVNYK